jgi:hypothetical protein
MTKFTAAIVLIVLTPIFLPVALIWTCFIAASHVVETWYRALEVLRQ